MSRVGELIWERTNSKYWCKKISEDLEWNTPFASETEAKEKSMRDLFISEEEYIEFLEDKCVNYAKEICNLKKTVEQKNADIVALSDEVIKLREEREPSEPDDSSLPTNGKLSVEPSWK